jgi:hypothetical protein
MKPPDKFDARCADKIYPWLEDEDNSPEMSNEEALDMLNYFRNRSLSKGYMIMPDFETLMQAVYVATTWYYERQGKE